MAGMFEDLIEEEKREKRENPTEDEIMKNFLNDGDFARKLIFFFPDYLISVLPEKRYTGNNNIDLSPILSIFQKRYIYLNRTEDWSEDMMKTVIWNMCLDREPQPFKLQSYFNYEDRYYTGLLRDYKETGDGPME